MAHSGFSDVAVAAAPYIRNTVVSEMNSPSDGEWIRESAYGPGVSTVAHRGYSGNRRLDVWAYADEATALRAAAKLAMECGLDQDPDAARHFKRHHYQAVIDRYNQTSPEWHVLQVQVANFIDESGDCLITSAEVDFKPPPTSGP
jgi:hypothetical protein